MRKILKLFVLVMVSLFSVANISYAQGSGEVGLVNHDLAMQSDIGQPLTSGYGPIKVKPLCISPGVLYSDPNSPPYIIEYPWFSVGDTIYITGLFEIKGTGNIKLLLKLFNSAGVPLLKIPVAATPINYGSFQAYYVYFYFTAPVSGYFTAQLTFTDPATGNSWVQQTKIHVE